MDESVPGALQDGSDARDNKDIARYRRSRAGGWGKEEMVSIQGGQ